MSVDISLNSLQYEAVPFVRNRPFINPDKAIVKNELPFTKNFQDRFTISGGGETDPYYYDSSSVSSKNHLKNM